MKKRPEIFGKLWRLLGSSKDTSVPFRSEAFINIKPKVFRRKLQRRTWAQKGSVVAKLFYNLTKEHETHRFTLRIWGILTKSKVGKQRTFIRGQFLGVAAQIGEAPQHEQDEHKREVTWEKWGTRPTECSHLSALLSRSLSPDRPDLARIPRCRTRSNSAARPIKKAFGVDELTMAEREGWTYSLLCRCEGSYQHVTRLFPVDRNGRQVDAVFLF